MEQRCEKLKITLYIWTNSDSLFIFNYTRTYLLEWNDAEKKAKIPSPIWTYNDSLFICNYTRPYCNYYLLEWNDAVKRQKSPPPSGPTVIVVVEPFRPDVPTPPNYSFWTAAQH